MERDDNSKQESLRSRLIFEAGEIIVDFDVRDELANDCHDRGVGFCRAELQHRSAHYAGSSLQVRSVASRSVRVMDPRAERQELYG